MAAPKIGVFKECFKYYKNKNPPPNYENVMNVTNSTSEQVRKAGLQGDIEYTTDQSKFGLKPVNCWEVFEFSEIAGLIFIRNPFTTSGQRYWITRCLRDYSRRPNKLNIDAHGVLEKQEEWWEVCTRGDERALELTPKLRWATLGYHHNWDTKHYSEDNKMEIPDELNEMTGFIVKCLGFDGFKAEAAIINFYRMNSTLAGHVDHSEDNLDAPLVSVSFGQSAIFLIGGLKYEDYAKAIFIQSGDILVMSGESRLRYHGVPKVLRAHQAPWDNEQLRGDDIFIDNGDWIKARDFISEARINMNVRQVLRSGQEKLNHHGVNLCM